MILDVQGVSVTFNSPRRMVRALEAVDMQIDRGEIVGIAGESGSGKTTLALAISRLIASSGKIRKGKIDLEGRNILTVDESEFRKFYRWKKIAMVFQGSMSGFTPVFSIGAQIDEVLRVHGYGGDIEKRIKELLDLVELEPRTAQCYPHELSGGQKQRAFIAMALALDPLLLILDEPTSALDVLTQTGIMNLLKTLRKERDLSILLISHDLALLSEIVDRVYVLYAGRIVEVGTSELIFKEPKHPYTKGLLAAVPTLNTKHVSTISGFMVDLANPSHGCRFAPRCPYVMTICREDEPQLRKVREAQQAACWLY